jgi:hypothetical protein
MLLAAAHKQKLTELLDGRPQHGHSNTSTQLWTQLLHVLAALFSALMNYQAWAHTTQGNARTTPHAAATSHASGSCTWPLDQSHTHAASCLSPARLLGCAGSACASR